MDTRFDALILVKKINLHLIRKKLFKKFIKKFFFKNLKIISFESHFQQLFVSLRGWKFGRYVGRLYALRGCRAHLGWCTKKWACKKFSERSRMGRAELFIYWFPTGYQWRTFVDNIIDAVFNKVGNFVQNLGPTCFFFESPSSNF